jgi:ABC-type glutathione transport system ATPase component
MTLAMLTSKDRIGSLSVDLTLSRVTLAAMRAKAHLSLSDNDRLLAKKLAMVFQKELKTLNPVVLSKAAISDNKIRRELELSLTRLFDKSTRYKPEEVELFDKLVMLLNELAENKLSEQSAADLLTVLLQFGSYPEKKPEEVPLLISKKNVGK